jgi:hypothetical protein
MPPSLSLWTFLISVALAAPALASGSIAGTIGFTGPVPQMNRQNRKSDLTCAKTQSIDPTVVVSKDGKALANVVVRIIKNVPAGVPLPTTPVRIDQKNCVFEPHVQAAAKGQKLLIGNGDGTLHNLLKDPKNAEVVKLTCDVHEWMTAYVVVSAHRFFAVSDSLGRFQIEAVAPGQYTVEAWHEKYGTKTAELTVEEGKPTDPGFSFSDRAK